MHVNMDTALISLILDKVDPLVPLLKEIFHCTHFSNTTRTLMQNIAKHVHTLSLGGSNISLFKTNH